MENRGGILHKSPNYVLEKYKSCAGVPYPEYLLDHINKSKLEEYKQRWCMTKGEE